MKEAHRQAAFGALFSLAACSVSMFGGDPITIGGPPTTTPAAPSANFVSSGSEASANFGSVVLTGEASAEDFGLFATLPTTAVNFGPALLEPPPGAVIPRNWAAPTFQWSRGTVPNVGEINRFLLVITVPGQTEPLRVLTTEPRWRPSASLWSRVRDGAGQGMRITVYGAIAGQPGAYSRLRQSEVRVLPADLSGSIVYWSVSDSSLHRVSIGENEPRRIFGGGTGTTHCVGCHTAAPDGSIGVTWDREGWGLTFISSQGQALPNSIVTPRVANALATGRNSYPAFSPAFWREGSRYVVYSNDGRLNASNLSSSSGPTQQEIRRDGDTRRAAEPVWSPDGTRVVYVSSEGFEAGRTTEAPTQLWSVPFNNGAGGRATPVPGASDSNFHQYYPSFSNDGRFLAFNRSALRNAENYPINTYDNPQGEVFVMPAAGGTPVRLAANDPSPDAEQRSPGLANQWPKWAPRTISLNGSTWYFLTFSSRRSESRPQLYVTPLEVRSDGSLQSYPAVLLPGPDLATSNHTPAWVD